MKKLHAWRAQIYSILGRMRLLQFWEFTKRIHKHITLMVSSWVWGILLCPLCWLGRIFLSTLHCYSFQKTSHSTCFGSAHTYKRECFCKSGYLKNVSICVSYPHYHNPKEHLIFCFILLNKRSIVQVLVIRIFYSLYVQKHCAKAKFSQCSTTLVLIIGTSNLHV